MAKFNFKLQNFLSIKEKLEEQKKLEYGKAISELELEKQKKLLLDGEKCNNIEQFRNEIEKRVDPRTFNSYNRYIDFLKKQIVRQEREIEKKTIFAEQKREELVQSVKERKMFDKLKEHAKESFIKEENLAEQKRLDEIVSYNYNKQ